MIFQFTLIGRTINMLMESISAAKLDKMIITYSMHIFWSKKMVLKSMRHNEWDWLIFIPASTLYFKNSNMAALISAINIYAY